MGYPQIRSAVYDADAEIFTLQIGGSESSSLTLFKAPVKIKYAEDFKKMLLAKDFKPTVHVRVDHEGAIRIAHIEELQNPEDRVINTAWAAAQGNIVKLNDFIAKFPEDKKRVAEARQQIIDIGEAKVRSREALGRLLIMGAEWMQKNYEKGREEQDRWDRAHNCRTIIINGHRNKVCDGG
jgi:hypothetical protein